MWAAGLIAFVGFVSVALLTHWSGVRLGGVVVVPLLAVYTLVNAWALPLFAVSVLVAYAVGALLEERTLVFGHPLVFLYALAGAVVPMVALALLSLTSTPSIPFRELALFGSILPGITAYNVRALPAGRRWLDAQMSVGLFSLLLVLGALLVSPETASRFGTLTPRVLFAPGADIAELRDATVSLVGSRPAIPRAVVLLPFAFGVGLVAYLRQRLGLHLGLVALPLVAVFTYYDLVVLALFLAVLAVTYGFETALHRQTLVYGRVLLGAGLAVAVLVTVVGGAALPIQRGTSALFAGILAGFGAHNLHLTARQNLSLHLSTTAAVFALSLGVVVAVVPFVEADPAWRQSRFALAVAAGLLLTGAAVARAVLAQQRAHEDRLLSAVSGGDQP